MIFSLQVDQLVDLMSEEKATLTKKIEDLEVCSQGMIVTIIIQIHDVIKNFCTMKIWGYTVVLLLLL